MLSKRIMLMVALAAFLPALSAAGGEEVTAGLAEVNGTKLYYEVKGQGHPLVFIHGGLLSSAEWDEQFHPFAEHYRTIRYDVRGFGKSETRKLPYSNTEIAGAKKIIIPNAGHLVDMEKPEEFNRIMLNFLSKQ